MKLTMARGFYISDVLAPDAAAYVEHLQEKQIHDQTLRLPYPYTEADALAWIARVHAETAERGQSLNWAIRKADGGLIGGIGLHDWGPEHTDVAMLGYWLAKPWWGQGVMTEAVRQVTAYGFDQLGLERMEADVFAFNLGSARVLEKAGYAFVRDLPARYTKNGHVIDARLFAKDKPV